MAGANLDKRLKPYSEDIVLIIFRWGSVTQGLKPKPYLNSMWEPETRIKSIPYFRHKRKE